MRQCVICTVDISHRHGLAKTCSKECLEVRRCETGRKYRQDYPEKARESVRKYQSDREKGRLRERAYRERNRVRVLENKRVSARKFRENNPEKSREAVRKHHIKLRAALKLVKEIQQKGLEALL